MSMTHAPTRKRTHSLSGSSESHRWIDEDIYRTTILSLQTAQLEREADEKLQEMARGLGILPVEVFDPSSVDLVAAKLSEVTIGSDNHHGSIISQSTSPTSCDSSERRPSTSLSNQSSILGVRPEAPAIAAEMERKRHGTFKIGLRKIGAFRKKKAFNLNTPSMASLHGSTSSKPTASTSIPLRSTISLMSQNNYARKQIPKLEEIQYEPVAAIDEEALQRSLECEQLARIRSTQTQEKSRFLEYQSQLIRDLREERGKIKAERRQQYEQKIAEHEEKVCYKRS